jgi:hypothetical protein
MVLLDLYSDWLVKVFFMAGIQQNLSIFIGIAMIAVILIPERYSQNIIFKTCFRFDF